MSELSTDDKELGTGLYWGLALVALATLMLQVALTRIFSVTMWYHMSLVSVSMAMFGMTVGALIVHWFPKAFRAELAASKAALYSLAFAVSTAVSLAVCLYTPFKVEMSAAGVARILYWNSMAAIPFLFSGVCVCLCLTRFPKKVGRLYAFDLAGASLGCLLVVFLLGQMDAISAILVTAAGPALAAFAFAHSGGRKGLGVAGLVLAVLLVGAGLHNSKANWLRIRYVLGEPYDNTGLLHEKWNVFSYITVSDAARKIYWGAGANARPEEVTSQMYYLTMDTRASTPLIKFDGDWDSLDWLMYDATNIAHVIRTDGEVLVVGAGGGRDILSALVPARGKRKVQGVEINPITVSLHTELEREFTGLADMENVELYNDEARSWIERTDDQFQVLTVPLVDTSAASAAGAFALTENSLYTVEAFELFLSKLTEDGVFSVSRFWFGGSLGEAHRLVAMGAQALRNMGVEDPLPHMYVARGSSLTTLLIAKQPFSEADLDKLTEAAKKYGFDELVTPRTSMEPNLLQAIQDPRWADRDHLGQIKLDLSPPTDDKPYFFHSYSISNLLSPVSWMSRRQPGVNSWDREAMIVLASLVVAVSVLCLAVVVVPLWVEWGKSETPVGHTLTSLGFFTLIGLGFMLFESAQMQRLSIFLGYPIYALTVVLFGLLLSSSLGASTVAKLWEKGVEKTVPAACLGLLVVMVVCGLLTPALQDWAAAAGTPVRVAVSLLMIAPPGFFLGMLFPLGLRLTERSGEVSLAWCWAINGAASTCAAVYSIALSISLGIGATYWIGFGCYVLACALITRLTKFSAAA